MLTNRLRKEIEWHFYNCKADMALYNEKVRDIVGSGLTVNYENVGGGSYGNRAEDKVIKLDALNQEKCWANVVRNTFTAFRFEPEYDIMVELYIKQRNKKELFSDGLWENTFYRWREKWLTYAYKWAKIFNIL